MPRRLASLETTARSLLAAKKRMLINVIILLVVPYRGANKSGCAVARAGLHFRSSHAEADRVTAWS